MIIKQRSPEWFEARKGRITASIVGAILGEAPYMSRDEAMRLIVREALGAEREFQGNIATEYGTNNEEGVLIDYRLETGNNVEEASFITFDDWAGASPDGFVGDNDGLEIKCPYGLRNAEAPVPFKTLAEQPHYYSQVQFTLFVTGRKHWDFFQWAPNGTALESVRPDQTWLAKNIPILLAFHSEYLVELEDPAQHLAPKRKTVDTPEAHKMVAELDELNAQIERATERKRDLLDSMVSMADSKDAIFAGRNLTCVERVGSVAYARVVKEHCADLDLNPYRGKPSKYWQVR